MVVSWLLRWYNDVRSRMTFYGDDILKRWNFLGFQILEKRDSLYEWLFRKVVGGFINPWYQCVIDDTTMCVPRWLFMVMTFWNEETFWVFKSWKREVASILWYLGKWFGGFRNDCCHSFFVVIKMCVPEWLFGGQTIWNEKTFWVLESWKREVASILWYLGKWFGGFRNKYLHYIL